MTLHFQVKVNRLHRWVFAQGIQTANSQLWSLRCEDPCCCSNTVTWLCPSSPTNLILLLRILWLSGAQICFVLRQIFCRRHTSIETCFYLIKQPFSHSLSKGPSLLNHLPSSVRNSSRWNFCLWTAKLAGQIPAERQRVTSAPHHHQWVLFPSLW